MLWFLAAVIGQWIFVYYVAGYYGPAILQGGLEGLKETHLPGGYVAGDTIGNLAVAAHLFLAVIIVGGGPLQIMLGAILSGGGPFQHFPKIQAGVRSFHHWNGRLYILAVFTTAIVGLYMIRTRGNVGGLVGEIAVSLDAVLIMVFAAIALRCAIARNIDAHRRWALRLFMVVSAVWFFRIGFMFWMMLTGGLGVDQETFTGPFLSFWFYGQYLVPLAVLEFYFRARDRADASGKFAMAAVLLVLTAATGIGTFAAYMGMWHPLL